MKIKTAVFTLLIVMILASLAFNASAITASIGNSRMILRLSPGQVIEKSILVKNINNISVEINLTSSGDLADSIVLKNPYFTLNPGEDGEANFTLTNSKTGTTETKIEVKFTDPTTKGGVVLASTIIVITNSTEEGNSTLPGNTSSSGSNSTVILLSILAFILVAILVILFTLTYRRRRKTETKEATKPKKSASKHE